jgi:hypothetical protein
VLRVFIRSRTWLRRWTISEVGGTTSLKFVHSSPSATLSRQISSAFRTRSNLVGDWGIAARIASWARVSWAQRLAEVRPGRGLHAVALVAVKFWLR